jgi:hypothetical protein
VEAGRSSFLKRDRTQRKIGRFRKGEKTNSLTQESSLHAKHAHWPCYRSRTGTEWNGTEWRKEHADMAYAHTPRFKVKEKDLSFVHTKVLFCTGQHLAQRLWEQFTTTN